MSRKKTDISFISEFHRNINILVARNSGNMRGFAKIISVDPDTVQSWCKGETIPNGKQLLKIHDKLSVSIDWLLTGRSGRRILYRQGEQTEYLKLKSNVDNMQPVLAEDDMVRRIETLEARLSLIERKKKKPLVGTRTGTD